MARNSVNKKAAPRRKVEAINRVGSWGRVEYHHELECGHVEIRKRASPTGIMACTGCVLTEEHEERISSPVPDPSEDDLILDQLNSRLAGDEKTIAQIKASVSSHYKVPTDAVEVLIDVSDEGEVILSSVLIILSADEVIGIVGETSPRSSTGETTAS